MDVLRTATWASATSLAITLLASNLHAAEGEAEADGYPLWEFGAQLGAGWGWAMTGESVSSASTSDDPSIDSTPEHDLNIPSPVYNEARFAYGATGLTGLYLNSLLACELGVGVLNRGYRTYAGSDPGEEENYHFLRVWYLTFPVGMRLEFERFRLGVGVALEFGIGASYEITDNVSGDRSGDLDNPWSEIRRVNWGPKLELGYAIPVSSLFVVPGVSWSMHVANDMPELGNLSTRYTNAMLTLGAFFRPW